MRVDAARRLVAEKQAVGELRDVIGRGPYPNDGPAFVAEYHDSERAYQLALYDQRAATTPASPYNAAAAFVRRQHPADARAAAFCTWAS